MNSDDGKQKSPPVATLEQSQPAPAPAPAARPAPAVSPSRKPMARRRTLPELEEEDRPKGFKRYRLPVFVGALALGAIIAVQRMLSGVSSAPQPKQEVQQVFIAPPPPSTPPPPPPPPPPETKQEEKLVDEVKQDDAPPEPSQMQTALAPGKGPGISGLTRGNGSGLLTNRSTVNAERMRWSAYGGLASNAIKARLHADPRTKKMVFNGVIIRCWWDSTGRVTRATFSGTSGDPALDAYARDEVVVGTQLSDGPPSGMPNPMIIRFNAVRPAK